MILHFREEKEKGISFSRDSRGEREIQNTNFFTQDFKHTSHSQYQISNAKMEMLSY